MYVSLLAFVGKALKTPYGNDIEQNFVYSFINNETVDGLITIASVGVFVSSQDYEMFVNHFSGLPLCLWIANRACEKQLNTVFWIIITNGCHYCSK